MRIVTTTFSNLLKNSKGILSIEFAIIIPVLVMLFFGMLEYNRVIYHQQKTIKVANTLADMFSMFKPLDVSKTSGELETECVNQPLMITDSRIKGILGDSVVEALMLPIPTDMTVIHVSSIYKEAGSAPKVAWQYTYQKNPKLVFPTAIGVTGANAKMPTVNGVVGGMLDGENFIVVESAIKYNSVIEGIMDGLLDDYDEGMLHSTTYYPIRNYTYGMTGLPEVGLNYVWPNKLPSTMTATTNPKGC